MVEEREPMEVFGQTKYMIDIRRGDLANLRGNFEALEASKSGGGDDN